jgi:hypothetical protein
MKKWSVLLSPKATIQIREAALYYNSKSKGLGKRFHGEINICLTQLVVNPYFQIRYDEIRRLPVSVFPYMLHFDLNEGLQKVMV